MNKKILMITSSFDKTCDYLVSKYTNINFFRFNLDKFSTYQLEVTSKGFSISNSHHSIDDNNCLSIYFRKPSNEDLTNIYDEKYHQFSFKESYAMIEGIAEAFKGKCLSKPSIMRSSGNKIFQALIAKEAKFKIPELSITNSTENVYRLKTKKSIVKPIATGTVARGNQKEYVQTNIIDDNVDLSLLKYTPAYFQNYIEKDYEVRSTFIGKKDFSVKIKSQNKIDWRKANNTISYETITLPNHIKEKCLHFLQLSGMEFGCFDFIVNSEEWFFLEMNTNGQWAWLEFETNLKISNEIINYLTN